MGEYVGNSRIEKQEFCVVKLPKVSSPQTMETTETPDDSLNLNPLDLRKPEKA